MFKQAFKHYKRRCPFSDLHEVIDLDTYEANITCNGACNLVEPMDISEMHMHKSLYFPVGLQPQHMWRCYTLKMHPGLLVIRNPFTRRGQRYWIARSLRDYPLPPNIVNLDAKRFSSKTIADWWGELHHCTDPNIAHRLKMAMRWTTLGYHHNWDTKVYDKTNHTLFPSDLGRLSHYISLALGFSSFIPQAAIINYYPIGTSLSGHTDHSETYHEAPLLSYSFGQTAIFLIGHRTLEEEPSALYLRSGDVLIMSKESRLSYHAVPRVLKAFEDPWNNFCSNPTEKLEDTVNSSINFELYDHVNDELFWEPFNRYVNDCRININVRQVYISDC